MRKDDARLEDINNAASRLAEYLAGITLEQFLEDDMRKAATVREMEAMGEAVTPYQLPINGEDVRVEGVT